MAGAIYPSLKGKTVFISGGAAGIGEGFVKAFHAQGSHVAFVDLTAETRARRLARELGGKIWFKACDVTDTARLSGDDRARPPGRSDRSPCSSTMLPMTSATSSRT